MTAPLVQRIRLTWGYGDGTWTLGTEEGTHIGFVQVTEVGLFKVNHCGRWISASSYREHEHFDTLDEAKQALQKAFLESRRST